MPVKNRNPARRSAGPELSWKPEAAEKKDGMVSLSGLLALLQGKLERQNAKTAMEWVFLPEWGERSQQCTLAGS